MGGDWDYGLFGCFDNCGLCIITYFVPFYTIGKTAEAVGDSCILCGLASCFFPCIIPLLLRGKVRDQHTIDGSCIGDICAVWLCPFCAVIQMNRQATGGGIERE